MDSSNGWTIKSRGNIAERTGSSAEPTRISLTRANQVNENGLTKRVLQNRQTTLDPVQ
jgi:hypothetical protein